MLPGSHVASALCSTSTSRVPYGGMGERDSTAKSSAFCSEKSPPNTGPDAEPPDPPPLPMRSAAASAVTCASGMPDSSVRRSQMPLRAATSPSWLSGFAAKKARMNAGTSVESSARREGRRSDCVGGGGERQQVQPYWNVRAAAARASLTAFDRSSTTMQ